MAAVIFVVTSFLLASVHSVMAAPYCYDEGFTTPIKTTPPFGLKIPDDAPSSTSFTFTINPLDPNRTFDLRVSKDGFSNNSDPIIQTFTTSAAPAGEEYVSHTITITKSNDPDFFKSIGNNQSNYLILVPNGDGEITKCVLGNYTISRNTTSCSFTWETNNFNDSPGCIEVGDYLKFSAAGLRSGGVALDDNSAVSAHLNISTKITTLNKIGGYTINNTYSDTFFMVGDTLLASKIPGYLTIDIIYDGNNIICTSPAIPLKRLCTTEDRERDPVDPGESNGEIAPFQVCRGIEGEQQQKCEDCAAQSGVWTALGCISFNPQDFISDFLSISIGIAGGIALLLMIYGSFLISTSAGDPKKAEEGKEIITGTIAGLLFIIFSVFLLKLIGVDILQIPGF